MVGVHDARLFSPWHLQIKRRACNCIGLGLAYNTALWESIAVWAKASSQPQPHQLADLTIGKADDHGVGGLLPAQVIPVFSIVGLEQILAELHRRPRRATDLLGGRECCKVGALTAHADVADQEAVSENELSDLHITKAGQVTEKGNLYGC